MAVHETRITEEKINAVQALKEEFSTASDYIFTNYRGLTVEQITNLRRKLRETDSRYKVIKNRFAKLALKDLEQPEVDDQLTGPTAVALPKGDATAAAKILVEFAKDAPVEIKGGIVDGRVFTADQIVEFSKLPTRDELLAKLVGTMQAPIQNFVYVLNAVPTKFVRVLQAVADQKEGE